jgi:hypothetical protein
MAISLVADGVSFDALFKAVHEILSFNGESRSLTERRRDLRQDLCAFRNMRKNEPENRVFDFKDYPGIARYVRERLPGRFVADGRNYEHDGETLSIPQVDNHIHTVMEPCELRHGGTARSRACLARTPGLNRRTRHGAVGTEYATIACLRL